MVERRECHFEYKSIPSRRTRMDHILSTYTQPAARSKSSSPKESLQLREQQQWQRHEDGDAEGTVFADHAIYLEELTAVELTEKIAQLFGISPRQVSQVHKQGPAGIHVLFSDEMIQNFQEEACFILDTLKETNDSYHIILK
nr:alpha-globin transcription factor CP2-like [Kogia breviceps]